MTAQTLRQNTIVQRSPIFYGWVIWFVATIGISATSPGQSFSISLFIDHYILDFGLDRTSVSGLYGLGTFIAALSLTWVGRRIDLHGNRMMSIAIALLFGLALLACSLVSGAFTILISFIAIRALGQGSMGLVNSTVIAQWFHKRRGWVMAMSLVGFALFQRFYVPQLQGFIDVHGWRNAWLLLGGAILLFVLPLLGLFLRNRPEDFGLKPDGEATSLTPGTDKIIEDNWTLIEAQRTPIFWVFIMTRVLTGAWGTALIFHQVSIFESLGYGAGVAATTYGQIALMTAGFTLFSGWLVDRLHPGKLIALQMLGLMTATALAGLMTESWLLIPYSAAFGVFMGIGSVFDGTVWVNLFGRQHQGAIRGFVATSAVIGTSIGPLVFGLSFDTLGDYHAALLVGIVLAMMILCAALLVKNPTRMAEAS
ncbi:MAG: MFS transporter [Aggregatilineales bacterium]